MLTVSDGFNYYVSLVKDKDMRIFFKNNPYKDVWNSIKEEESTRRYREGKWSIKQVLGHVIDHERIMGYRILRFSRKDTTELAGYDQDELVKNARFDELSYEELLQDYSNVRESTLSLLNSLNDEQMLLKGKAWEFELTVEDFFRAIIGHEAHHSFVVTSKYLDY